MDTSFIADNPSLLANEVTDNRGNRLLSYIGNVSVNGPPEALGAVGPRCAPVLSLNDHLFLLLIVFVVR